MITKKTWEHRELAGASPLGRFRVERWEGWYLFGHILLRKRQAEVYFTSKGEDSATSSPTEPEPD